MSINYTYTVIGTTKKEGGNGEILNVHVDLVGTDSNEKKSKQTICNIFKSTCSY